MWQHLRTTTALVLPPHSTSHQYSHSIWRSSSTHPASLTSLGFFPGSRLNDSRTVYNDNPAANNSCFLFMKAASDRHLIWEGARLGWRTRLVDGLRLSTSVHRTINQLSSQQLVQQVSLPTLYGIAKPLTSPSVRPPTPAAAGHHLPHPPMEQGSA